MDARGYEAALAARLDEIVGLTRRLVEVDSPTDVPSGVASVGEVVADAAAAEGAIVAVEPIDGYGPLLDANWYLGDGPTVLVLGHADTVWPSGTVAEWPFRVEGGLLSGPGVGDMKACLAVAVHALGLVAAAQPAGVGTLRLLVVPDEEHGTVATRPAVEAAAREAAACLTLEAARPGGELVTGRGAVGAMRIAATGVARHVTDAGADGSALRPLAALVGPLERLGDPGAGTQVRVGVLRAGTARQVVPGSGELLVDLRAETTAAAETAAEAVRRLVRDVERPPNVQLHVEGGVTRPAWPRGPGSLRLLGLARQAAAPLGLELGEVVERGGSDASFPGALGVPTLDGLGPVCHDSCSRAERVEIASLAPRGAILAALAEAAARQS